MATQTKTIFKSFSGLTGELRSIVMGPTSRSSLGSFFHVGAPHLSELLTIKTIDKLIDRLLCTYMLVSRHKHPHQGVVDDT